LARAYGGDRSSISRSAFKLTGFNTDASNGLPLPFSPESVSATAPARVSARHARRLADRSTTRRMDETDGVLHQLLGDYTI
jgi:hypothetical protein